MARQQQHQGGMADPIAARQKEEQRRRQQAYAQALAQQVQQRELQKQRDRDLDRQGTGHGRPPGQQGFHDPSDAGKGLFGGFGEKGNQNRTNFARGQRQLPPQTQHQDHQQVSPGNFGDASQGYPETRDQHDFQYNNNGFQQQQQGFSGGFNPDFGYGNPQILAQPQQLPNQQQQTGLSDWGAPLQPQSFGFHSLNEQQNGHHHQQHQQEQQFPQHFDQRQQPQYQGQQQPQYQEPQHSRGLRADPSSAGCGAGVPAAGGEDDSKARRKLQQQMEIQNALQKQVEEKNRLKLEAKRRQDDEDRREVERFEAEQRRLKQEEDRVKDEKRRKAEEELVRAQQAAAALAEHQKKTQHHIQSQQQQQQVYQQQQASPQRTLHNQQPIPAQHQQHNRKSPQKLDPFSNTRAHLFQDPPSNVSPQRQMLIDNFNPGSDERPLDNQVHRSGFRSQVHQHHEKDDHEQETPIGCSMRRQPESFPKSQHCHEPRDDHSQWPQNPQPPQFLDSTVLLRQYNEMKQELFHQRQIVDQLREAHEQIQQQQRQQQSISKSPSDLTPTISDLEQLRNELREELQQREQLHRQEIEKFRRQQGLLQSVNLQSRSSSNEALGSTTSRFVLRSNDDNNQHSTPAHTTTGVAGVKRPGQSQERELGSAFSQAVLNHNSHEQQLMIPPASLQCDSKMVYFDGQVRQEQTEAQVPPSRKPAELVMNQEDSMDELVSQLDLVDQKQQRASVVSSKSLARENGNNQSDRVASRRDHQQPELSQDDDSDEDDDALAFFIKDFREPVLPPSQRLSLRQKSQGDGTGARASGRYSSWMADDEDDNDEHFSAAALSRKASSRLRSRAQRFPNTLELDEEHEDNEEESELSGSASLSGEELEAIFQRNVRRHEILLSFQPKRAHQNASSNEERRSPKQGARSMAWTQLHQQLEANIAATSLGEKKKPASDRSHTQQKLNEDSLIASSRWMPSAI